jgi:hypothetical protein
MRGYICSSKQRCLLDLLSRTLRADIIEKKIIAKYLTLILFSTLIMSGSHPFQAIQGAQRSREEKVGQES